MGKIHLYQDSPTSGGVDGVMVSEGNTTLAAQANAGASALAVVDGTKVTGTKVTVGVDADRETKTVSSVVGNTVNISTPLTNTHLLGASVHYSISVELNNNGGQESAPIKLALRCETGFKTFGDTTVIPLDTVADGQDETVKWALAPDNSGAPGAWGAYGAALVISTVIAATNTIMWAKAKCLNAETQKDDVSIDIKVDTNIEAA